MQRDGKTAGMARRAERERERERDEKDEKETDLRERRWGPNQPEITSRNAHGNRKSPVQITFTTKL
jgi:hypothetical protein